MNFFAIEAKTSSESWREYANCKGMDTNLFFPERGQDTRDAKKICSTCLVQSECLNYGILYGEKNGIWGGKSERQRRAQRRVINLTVSSELLEGETWLRNEENKNSDHQLVQPQQLKVEKIS